MRELVEDNRERRVRITDKSLPGKSSILIEMNCQVFLLVGVKLVDIVSCFF